MKAMQRAESGVAPWIEERGPRYGNKRKAMSRAKVEDRRRTRAKDKVRQGKEIKQFMFDDK